MQITVYSPDRIRKKWITAVTFMLLTLLQCMIINMFSSQRAEISGAASRGIVDYLEDIVKWIFGVLSVDSVKEFSLTHIVRKAAHFYNFAVLGILLCTDKSFCKESVIKTVLWCAAGLLMAMLDEFHQYFVPGRSAEIRDVMIDFSGVMFGMCFLKTLLGIIFKTEVGYEKRRYDIGSSTKKS